MAEQGCITRGANRLNNFPQGWRNQPLRNEAFASPGHVDGEGQPGARKQAHGIPGRDRYEKSGPYNNGDDVWLNRQRLQGLGAIGSNAGRSVHVGPC